MRGDQDDSTMSQRPQARTVYWHWEPVCLLQGSFGPFGPKVEKKSENESLGPLGPRGPKSPKQSRKRVQIDYCLTISTPFWTFWAPGSRGPGDPFSDFFPTLGLKGPNDPCSRQTGSRYWQAFAAQNLVVLPQGEMSHLCVRVAGPAALRDNVRACHNPEPRSEV